MLIGGLKNDRFVCVGFAARDLVRDPKKDKVNIKAVDGLTVGGFSFAIVPGGTPPGLFLCPPVAAVLRLCKPLLSLVV